MFTDAGVRELHAVSAIDLHYNRPVLEFSFDRAFEELIYFLLNLLADLFPAAFLADRARDVLYI